MNHNWNNRRPILAAIGLLAILLALLLFTNLLGAQEATEKPAVKPVAPIKTWRLPDDLLKNLRDMVAEFNKRFQETLDIYKAGLKATAPEFKGMPEDVVFDMQTGLFMKREDYVRLQADILKQQAEQAKKNKEVKENEKKIP